MEVSVNAGPSVASAALHELDSPDYADICLVPLPPGAPADPETWARAIFDVRALPRWVAGLMAVRQALVGLIGIRRGDASVFDIHDRLHDEVLIRADERHLDMRVGVGVDPDARLVWTTTAVVLHGWRGRLYFAPVRALHPLVVRSMMHAAARRLTPAAPER
jgi:hypothetical protein